MIDDWLKTLPDWVPWIVAVGLVLGWLGDRVYRWKAAKGQDIKKEKDFFDLQKDKVAELTRMLREANEEIDRLKLAQGNRFSAPEKGAAPSSARTHDEKDAESVALTAKQITAKPEPEGEEKDIDWLYAYIDDEFEKALDLLEKKIDEETDPKKKIDLESWKGRVQYRMDPIMGSSELESLIEKYPENVNPYLHLANAYRVRDLHEQSLEVIERGLERVADKGPLFKVKTSCLQDIGDDELAVDVLRNAILEFPDLPDPYLLLSELLIEQEKDEEARSVLEEGIQNIPEHEQLLSEYASLLFEDFGLKEALYVYHKLVTLAPDNPAHRARRGNVLTSLDSTDLAMEDYKQANQLAEEKEAWILSNIGSLLIICGLYTEGIEYLKRSIEIESDSEFAHSRLADAIKLQGEEDKKLSEFQKEARSTLLARRKSRAEVEEGPLDPPPPSD